MIWWLHMGETSIGIFLFGVIHLLIGRKLLVVKPCWGGF